jgi:hypothetical protein
MSVRLGVTARLSPRGAVPSGRPRGAGPAAAHPVLLRLARPRRLPCLPGQSPVAGGLRRARSVCVMALLCKPTGSRACLDDPSAFTDDIQRNPSDQPILQCPRLSWGRLHSGQLRRRIQTWVTASFPSCCRAPVVADAEVRRPGVSVVYHGEPQASWSEWHADGTASEDEVAHTSQRRSPARPEDVASPRRPRPRWQAGEGGAADLVRSQHLLAIPGGTPTAARKHDRVKEERFHGRGADKRAARLEARRPAWKTGDDELVPVGRPATSPPPPLGHHLADLQQAVPSNRVEVHRGPTRVGGRDGHHLPRT